MKAYRVKYYIPTEKIHRSKKITASSSKDARAIFTSQALSSGSSAIIESIQEDHCKNCGK